jgi:hypothetical protein
MLVSKQRRYRHVLTDKHGEWGITVIMQAFGLQEAGHYKEGNLLIFRHLRLGRK